jgi:hypothetical protein
VSIEAHIRVMRRFLIEMEKRIDLLEAGQPVNLEDIEDLGRHFGRYAQAVQLIRADEAMAQPLATAAD